jgi:hypothetical protein
VLLRKCPLTAGPSDGESTDQRRAQLIERDDNCPPFWVFNEVATISLRTASRVSSSVAINIFWGKRSANGASPG